MVNVDVSNTTFWHSTTISHLALKISGCSDLYDLGQKCKPVEHPREGGLRETPVFQALKRLHKNEFFVQFRNSPQCKLLLAHAILSKHKTNSLVALVGKIFKIQRVSTKTARTFKFDLRNQQTGEIEPNTSVFDYFQRKYNIYLSYGDLPLLETTKKGVVYPMEVCHMCPGQRYPFKLNEDMV